MIPIFSSARYAAFLGILFFVILWFGAPLIEINGAALFVTVQARLILGTLIGLAISLAIFIERFTKRQKFTD